ncbi:hypothetical protein Leryth_016255 [Lithospermum erythrorhizon]|nr:hypothetical protein Leryth_016255 [Lithospermum erythrorhizon]
METFKLLKFWRNVGGENLASSDIISHIDYLNIDYTKTPHPTITTRSTIDVQTEYEDDDDSLFELEFTELNASKKSNKNCTKFLDSPTNISRSKSNTSKPQSPISTLRSAPKRKVLLMLLRFKKSKIDMDHDSTTMPKTESQKSFEISKDNSFGTKMMREILEETDVSINFNKSEKKYLKLIKPLYTVASKRYRKFSVVSPVYSPRRRSDEKQRNNSSGLRVVYKHLGKSRSGSSAGVNRRDDSLILHDDGIQSAILHCKRSYNSNYKEFSRCSSDSFREKLVNERSKEM